ncbi:MAG: PAS domain-containing protein [Alphaproteobacteria bacterium]|nr:PAS domain-containing protein [Alphaproteobacteria bacterium]
MLNTQHPVYIFWGAEGFCLYNDAYRPSIGPERHPASLGRPALEVWGEIWPIIGHQLEQVMAGGGATWHENQPMPMTRNGVVDEVYWTYSYSPIDDETAPGGIGGVLTICTETTAAVEANRRLKDSEERLQQALSAGRGVGTWDWDVVTDTVTADARFAKIYGVDPEKAQAGAPIGEFFANLHPDDAQRLQDEIAIVLGTGNPLRSEYRLVQPDGGIHWVLAEGRPTLDADGTPLRLPGVTFDISERKEIEARQSALLAVNDAIRDLTDPADIAYASAEVLAKTLNVSRAGYGVVDTVAETITIDRDFNAPGVQSIAGVLSFRDFGSYIEDLKRGETVAIGDAALDPRTRDGAEALAGISATSLLNMPLVEQGKVVALVFANNATPRIWTANDIELMRDVAERVRVAAERARAAMALQDSEQQFRVFAQAMPNHVWASRPDGWIYWYNDQVYQYCGKVEGDLDGPDAWGGVLHPDDLPAAGEAWAHALATGELYNTEFRIRSAAGAWRWFLARAEPVRDESGAIVRWVGTNTDVEDMRRQRATLASFAERLEEQVAERTEELTRTHEALRQSQKMEAVGQLTGGIAHDFNNLLAGISGSLELLSKRLSEGRLNGMERYIDAAQGSAQRAASLTQRLLAFSRRQTLDPKPTDVNRLINGMEDLIRRSVGPDVEVEVVGAGGLWATRIDQSQLENALLNLCINARDAMAPDGGRLTIETSNKWLDDRAAHQRELPPGQYVSLCVTDSGTGMPPEVQAQAFDPFFTTKPQGQGTGLGLSMIHGFVRQSGGQVRIYSEMGKGTTMCLYLPRHSGDVDGSEDISATAVAEGGHGETVLIIDDEETVRMLVAEVLGDAGYNVIEAPDGPAGLEILRSDRRIDLLISDVGLPGGMNGRQVADAARESRPDLRVLFITGYAENAAVGNGLLAPGMEVLTKPFVMGDLAAKVHDMIEG